MARMKIWFLFEYLTWVYFITDLLILIYVSFYFIKFQAIIEVIGRGVLRPGDFKPEVIAYCILEGLGLGILVSSILG